MGLKEAFRKVGQAIEETKMKIGMKKIQKRRNSGRRKRPEAGNGNSYKRYSATGRKKGNRRCRNPKNRRSSGI